LIRRLWDSLPGGKEYRLSSGIAIVPRSRRSRLRMAPGAPLKPRRSISHLAPGSRFKPFAERLVQWLFFVVFAVLVVIFLRANHEDPKELCMYFGRLQQQPDFKSQRNLPVLAGSGLTFAWLYVVTTISWNINRIYLSLWRLFSTARDNYHR
jgi:hypothetical protein